jgi:hypothetical protein
MSAVDDPRRLDVVVLNVTVVLRRDSFAEDNGPPQAVSAIYAAVKNDLDGAIVTAQEYAGRQPADYLLMVTDTQVAGDWQRRKAFEELGLDQDGRPIDNGTQE